MAFSNPRGLTSEQLAARWMAAAFLLYGLLATAFLAVNVPPFQNPDEPAHFLRAAQIAEGVLIGTRFAENNGTAAPQVTAGGLSDPAISQAAAPFASIAAHREEKVARADWVANVHWTRTRSLISFPNTAMYPPFLYLPSAVGVLSGRIANLSVLRTLVVSRLLSGMTAVALGALAIIVAGGAAPWLFAILTLPMSLSLFASASQDGLLIAVSALAGAFMVRLSRWPTAQNWKLLTWLVVALSLVGMARPPYGPLALLPFGLQKIRLRWRILASIAIAASVVIWSALVAATTWTSFASTATGAEPLAQLELLRHDPVSAITAAFNTLKQYGLAYVATFIGVLGSLDTILPRSYYVAAAIALIIAALATILGVKSDRVGGINLPSLVGAILSVAAVFGIQYLTWTPPGHATIEGVQGRYFLPIALTGMALFPALGNARMARINNWLVLLVIAFPLVSLAVVMRSVILRYYLQ